MNCRTVRVVAIAIGLCVAAATTSNALAAKKEKAKRGVIAEITMPKAAVGSTAAESGKIKITVKDPTTKAASDVPYDLADSVSVTVNGDPAELKDLAVGDKIGFMLTDGKVSKIIKGHKKKKSQ